VALDGLRLQAADELRSLLQFEASEFPGREWASTALRTPGKLLSNDNGGFVWGLLPLLVIEAAGGQPRTGLPLAAATEFLIAASDVLDDVEDGDSIDGLERKCGIPTAVNVATFLVFMGQIAIQRLSNQGLRPEIVCDVSRVLARAAVRACGGQQRDIDQDDALLSESGYLEMVEAKSGALVAGMCHAAAIVAGASTEAIEAYTEFGRNLGIALQISNDVRAASIKQHERNDVELFKRTLPLIFAAEHAPALAHQLVAAAPAPHYEPHELQFADILNTSGGILYASVVADVYFEQAFASLDRAGASDSSGLRVFLGSIGQ
jgi:geranylgeranyl pyrophosphate synthase